MILELFMLRVDSSVCVPVWCLESTHTRIARACLSTLRVGGLIAQANDRHGCTVCMRTQCASLLDPTDFNDDVLIASVFTTSQESPSIQAQLPGNW